MPSYLDNFGSYHELSVRNRCHKRLNRRCRLAFLWRCHWINVV